MLRISAYLALAFCAILTLSCGKSPTAQANNSSLVVNATIDESGTGVGLSRMQSTSWNRLVISVTASDMAELRDTELVVSGISLQTATISPIPAGSKRIVCAYTIDATGDTVHAPAYDTINVSVGQTAVASLSLHPRMGSIMMQLTGADPRIDSISLSFVTALKTWSAKVKSGVHPYASLDYIPYGTSGILTVTAIDSSGKIILSWTKNPFVMSDSNSTISSSFVNTGMIQISTHIISPGTNLITGLLSSTDTLQSERSGPDSVLVISEIMFTGGTGSTSCDYVEIANPCAYPQNFDTLFLDVLSSSNSTKTMTGISIPAHGFIVAGNVGDSAIFKPTVTLSLDLVATSTQLSLRTKRNQILDRVFYENDQNSLGWPVLSSSAKTAVALDSIAADPLWNNYGSHWHKCTSTIGSSTYFGTPGTAGL